MRRLGSMKREEQDSLTVPRWPTHRCVPFALAEEPGSQSNHLQWLGPSACFPVTQRPACSAQSGTASAQ